MPRQYQSWEVSDAFWQLVEPLVPQRQRPEGTNYKRKPGAGRKRIPPRRTFEAIVFVLRTGIQWKALPKEFGSASAVHKYFQQWEEAGFFHALWQRGLAEYDDLVGIAWEWQAIDGCKVEAPLGHDAVGNSPVDRGKKGIGSSFSGGRSWRPVVSRRGGSESARCEPIGGGVER